MLLYLYTQQFIQFNVNYVGDYCQGWGREFESRFPLQNFKSLSRKIGAFFIDFNQYFYLSEFLILKKAS